jgi:hypothetical protein
MTRKTIMHAELSKEAAAKALTFIPKLSSDPRDPRKLDVSARSYRRR